MEAFIALRRRFGFGRRRVLLTLLLVPIAACQTAFADGLGELAVQESVLKRWSLEPTAESLSEYLRQLHPSAEQRRQAARLVEQLGSRDFFEREAATRKLLAVPILPFEDLTAAARGGDAEVRWRAKRILAKRDPDRAPLLYAVLRTIELRKLSGTAREVLRVIPLCDKEYLRAAAQAALVAAARPEDAASLREALGSEHADVQAAAASALGNVLGKKAVADLEALLQDPDRPESVTLAAARALAGTGDRRSLPVLVERLSSNDVKIRAESSEILGEVTGRHFGFLAYEAPERRAAAVNRWKGWVETEGETAPLLPLKHLGAGSGSLNGHTLLAFGYNDKVAEYDPTGKEVWTYSARGVWSAEKLSSGNVLIAVYYLNKVQEISPDHQVVWEYDAHRPLNAKLLRNGNVLIALASEQKAVEVSRDKEIVWEYKTSAGNCRDAHRLDNGNTLVAAGNLVVEVTPDKEVVWEYRDAQPFGLHPLGNGNVLIADFNGRAIEVTREKEIVWEHAVSKPGDVYRLPNGNTLITTYTQFLAVTPDHKVVWTKPGCRYGTARR